MKVGEGVGGLGTKLICQWSHIHYWVELESGSDQIPLPALGSPAMVTTSVLPQNLWPHSFFHLTIILAVVLGILNVLTLLATIPAASIAIVVCKPSKQHYNSQHAQFLFRTKGNCWFAKTTLELC